MAQKSKNVKSIIVSDLVKAKPKAKKKRVKLKKDGTVDKRSTRDKSTYKPGKQFGNKNAVGNSGRKAVKWTEKNAIKLGEDLIAWMKAENTNIFWQDYLVIQRDLYSDLINDLRAKYSEFDRLMKKADEIQLTKIMKWSSVNKLNAQISIFVMKTKHGMKEVNGLEHSGSIKTLADIAREAEKE
jgi:hypothetical protein